MPLARYIPVYEDPRKFNWGVISAVQNFFRSKGHQVHLTWLHDCTFLPQRYVQKG